MDRPRTVFLGCVGLWKGDPWVPVAQGWLHPHPSLPSFPHTGWVRAADPALSSVCDMAELGGTWGLTVIPICSDSGIQMSL